MGLTWQHPTVVHVLHGIQTTKSGKVLMIDGYTQWHAHMNEKNGLKRS